MNKYSNITINYITGPAIVDLVTKRNRRIINARIKAIDQNIFEKSDGNIRALIVNLDARDVIRALVDDENIRDNPNYTEYEKIKNLALPTFQPAAKVSNKRFSLA